MLKRLTVENFVLIDRLDIELAEGLNIITGETGAGKSILLGALGLLLGARAESVAIKDPTRNCVVEGVFRVQGYGLEGFFEENELDYGDELTVRRVIGAGGKSRSYVNDLPVQLTVLKELGVRLIDIHSQHQSLMLSSEGFRLGLLDSVADNRGLLAEYATAYRAMQTARREYEALKERVASEAREQDWLQFQCDQLREAALKQGEQQELEQLQGELSHAGQIQQALSLCEESLDGEQGGILPSLKAASQAVAHTAAYYPRAGELHERLNSAYLELKDLAREVSSEAQRIDSDPAKLQRTDDRLSLLYSLQKKHAVEDEAALIALYEDYSRRLEGITSAGESLETLEKVAAEARAKAAAVAARLTEKRTKAAAEVERHVAGLLAELGMPGARLVVQVEGGAEPATLGADSTRFMFTANRNVAPQPVEKVASGGETSRLMLALKSLVAERKMLPTIIFDEIDAGVSGQIADRMGEIICRIGSGMQVVNITHLPQVASKGETHFVVYKEHLNEGTVSRIRRLSADERISEIAKMLSGSAVTEAATAQARLLLGL